MPIYVFGCDECEHEWEELLLKTTDKPPEKCEKCGADNPKKRPTGCIHKFVGSGIGDGVGGWEMNAKGSLQRVVKGKNSTHYGN